MIITSKWMLDNYDIEAHDKKWLNIIKDYRKKYEEEMPWHEYLMEFYYPPEKIKLPPKP